MTMDRASRVVKAVPLGEAGRQANLAQRRGLVQLSPRESSWEVIGAKLSPPPLGLDVIGRPRLEERLSLSTQRGLKLLVAPAGFGKTTLLTQWCSRRAAQFAWLSLDADDNDPIRFWTHVTAALQSVRPTLGAGALDLLRERQVSVQLFVTCLLHDVSALPDDILLVLDGYQAIKNETIHDGVGVLLDHLPPQMHVIIATRVTPSLPLARWRASGQLAEMGTRDLAFSTDETATYVRDVLKLSISAEEVLALEKCSEGWIAGLRLAASALCNGEDVGSFVESFTGDHRHVSDYFREEVTEALSSPMRRFLLQTSILDRLNGALCDAVTGRNDGHKMLERLERASIFVWPLDEQRRWYRYHRLFRSYLAAELQRVGWADPPGLQRRACEWYRKQGMIREAVPHALSAGDFELATALIGQSAVAILDRGDAAMILSWLKSVPPEILALRPQLAITQVMALLLAGQADAAEALLRTAENGLGPTAGDPSCRSASGPKGEQGDDQVTHLQVMAARASIAAVRRDLPRLLALSREALDLTECPDPWPLEQLGAAYRWSGDLAQASRMLVEASRFNSATGHKLVAVVAANNLARVRVAQGLLHQAAATWAQAIRLAGFDGQVRAPIAGLPILGLAALNYEWNNLAEARAYVAEGSELAKQGGLLDILLRGQGLTARLRVVEGDVEGALDAMERVERLARQNNLTHELGRIGVLRARLWLAQGDLAATSRWAFESGLSTDDEPTYDRESGHVTLARLLVEQGKARQAMPLLSHMLTAANTTGRVGSAIKIQVTMAVALHADGRTREALESLATALSLAEPEGYVRSFADAGPVLAGLLPKLLDPRWSKDLLRCSRGYVRSLIETWNPAMARGSDSGTAPRIHVGLLDLSEREMDVLKLIAAGKSPREIAERLVLSLNTVKTHMYRIYEKLEAHTAVEAVANARSRQLL